MKTIGAIRIGRKWVSFARGQKVCAVIAPTCVQMGSCTRQLLGRDVVFYLGGNPYPPKGVA